jgi:hypothetical protein
MDGWMRVKTGLWDFLAQYYPRIVVFCSMQLFRKLGAIEQPECLSVDP